MDVIDPGRKLLTVTPARCTSLVSCGTEMSAADGVCAFAPPERIPLMRLQFNGSGRVVAVVDVISVSSLSLIISTPKVK